MDEFFETLLLMQTKKIDNFPVIVMGESFWQPLQEFIEKSLLSNGTVSKGEFSCISTDSPKECADLIASFREKACGSAKL